MLLARRGYRVLLVDRATFPSDTLSTHVIHAPGVAALRRWGLLDQVIATAYAPRRTVLDKLLVDGADGRYSHVARAVRPHQYHQKPKLQWSYYSYWSGLPVRGMEIVIRPDRGWAAVPTNDGLTLLVVGWPYAESKTYKADIEGNYLATLELVPEVRAATRQERFAGGGVPNFFRKPFGRGWALVGDAGYTKDPVTAQGISDAFRDAELCATALDQTFAGASSFQAAMAAYQHTRDAQVLPIYEFTAQLATLAPPPVEVQRLHGAVAGNREAMDAFASVYAGTLSPVEFFDPDHVERILRAA